MNKVPKSNGALNFGVCKTKITICCSTKNDKENHSGASKPKIMMISSKTYFAPTSDLMELIDQIRWAQKASLLVNDSLVRFSMFSQLSSTPPTLYLVVLIPERFQ